MPRPDKDNADQIAAFALIGIPAPTENDVGGKICPAGGYCETGSAWPKYCQGGKYNPSVGKKTVYDCIECTPGQYCSGAGGAGTSGNCDDGYYCEKGSPVID